MKWKWPGPIDGGMTQSMINMYLQDPFCFVLYYGLGLEEPTHTSQEILWGNIIHKGLELSIEKPTIQQDFLEEDWEEIFQAMKLESNKEIYTHPTSYYSAVEMLKLYKDHYKLRYEGPFETEVEFMFPYETKSNKVTLMGKVDGLHKEGILVEHKSKKRIEYVDFQKEIKHDLQVNMYCLATGARHIIYDIFIVPEFQYNCPTRNNYERDAGYIKRIYHQHNYNTYPVAKNKVFWVYQYEFDITSEHIKSFFRRSVDPILDQICMLYEYTSQDNFDPFNEECYNHLFYQKPIRTFDPAITNNYKSRYWNYLTGQLDITDLRETPKLFKELKIGK